MEIRALTQPEQKYTYAQSIEVGNHLYHNCEFAEKMKMNGQTYEPKPQEPTSAQKAPKNKEHER